MFKFDDYFLVTQSKPRSSGIFSADMKRTRYLFNLLR
jgi:hypothetical protein